MQRSPIWLVLAITGMLHAAAGERLIDFNKFPLDQSPAGFTSLLSGTGQPGEWKVILDSNPPATDQEASKVSLKGSAVLAQLARDQTDEHFPMLFVDQSTYGDFTLTTRFKIVDGQAEQMAGIAFRIQDTNNYYYVRASALGNTFRFIKLVNGQRLTTVGPSVEIPKGTWHDLAVECKGNRIECLLDGKPVIPPLTDNTFLSGRIAFWTKSDSVSYFGETKITFVPHENLAQVLVREALRNYPRLLGIRIYGTSPGEPTPKVIASNYEDEVGQPGGHAEQEVITRDVVYSGKERQFALVTLPLHDRNGEVVGAVRVVMQSFLGQTEQNVLARAQPIVKEMEKRIRSAKDLLE